jgi:hypothetical protein
MTWIPDNNRLTPVLSIICGMLLMIIAIEFVASRQGPEAQETATKKVAATRPSLRNLTYNPPAVYEFDEIIERHLFMADRRPAKESAPEIIATPIRLSLEGVAMISGAKVALVRDMSNDQLLRLSEGMSHRDWIVETVDAAGATFTRGEESVRLLLEQ